MSEDTEATSTAALDTADDQRTADDVADVVLGVLVEQLLDGQLRTTVGGLVTWLIGKLRERVSVCASIDDQLQLRTEAWFAADESGTLATLARHSRTLQEVLEEYFDDWETEDLPKLAAELRRLAAVVDSQIAARQR